MYVLQVTKCKLGLIFFLNIPQQADFVPLKIVNECCLLSLYNAVISIFLILSNQPRTKIHKHI